MRVAKPISLLRPSARAMCVSLASVCLQAMATAGGADHQAAVFSTERAFARSMAERNWGAFALHVSEQAVFFDGNTALRGKAAVLAVWRAYFEGAQAPFSWEPDQVVVLDDGLLAHSSGLVRNPAGQPIGRFNSVWRQEAPGVWRVVMDKGSPLGPADRH